MKYLLDTDVCIAWLNGKDASLRARLLGHDPKAVCSCAVVKAELGYGARCSARPAENLRKLKVFWESIRCLPLDDEAAEHAAEIRADLRRRGRPVGPNDLLIAAIARSQDLVLVTRNTRELSQVTGLELETW